MENDIRSRIESRFIPEPNSGCFIWTGALNGGGYAMLTQKINGVKRQRRAHRLYYELEKGPIPEGLTLDHLCRVRCCVNPDHLEPVTPVENVMRGESFYARQARRTHCPQGHPYAGENLFFTKKGERKCRICDRIHALKWMRNNPERAKARRTKNYHLAKQRKKENSK